MSNDVLQVDFKLHIRLPSASHAQNTTGVDFTVKCLRTIPFAWAWVGLGAIHLDRYGVKPVCSHSFSNMKNKTFYSSNTFSSHG